MTSGDQHLQPPRTDDLPPLPHRLHLVMRRGVRAYLNHKYDVVSHDTHHVPRTGGVILAPNHLGILDGPLLGAYSPRMIHAVSKIEAFTGFQGWLLTRVGQIPIDRFSVDTRAVRQAIHTLRDGRVLSVYPEGIRGAGDFRRVRTGVAYLAMVTGVPIVPVALLGTRAPGQDVDSKPPKGTRIDVVYGEPIHIEPVSFPRRQFDVRAVADEIGAVLRTHVQKAVVATGNPLPGLPGHKGT
ncbi:lysophospholipid acyltransferase family protein [Kribbella deserti]|uniref:Lysophospholipid acyltransferase family protein n=1 Tax=Kribbella deserti TaxID=1926257 RepID=A0ABV6QMG6_9ACTN